MNEQTEQKNQQQENRLKLLKQRVMTSNVRLYKLVKPEVLKKKFVDQNLPKRMPWHEKRSDLTDYFNYGFNEQTFQLYLNKLNNLCEAKSSEVQIGYRDILDLKMPPFGNADSFKDSTPIDLGGISTPFSQTIMQQEELQEYGTINFYDKLFFQHTLYLSNEQIDEYGYYTTSEEVFCNEFFTRIFENYHQKLMNDLQDSQGSEDNIYSFNESLKHLTIQIQKIKKQHQQMQQMHQSINTNIQIYPQLFVMPGATNNKNIIQINSNIPTLDPTSTLNLGPLSMELFQEKGLHLQEAKIKSRSRSRSRNDLKDQRKSSVDKSKKRKKQSKLKKERKEKKEKKEKKDKKRKRHKKQKKSKHDESEEESQSVDIDFDHMDSGNDRKIYLRNNSSENSSFLSENSNKFYNKEQAMEVQQLENQKVREQDREREREGERERERQRARERERERQRYKEREGEKEREKARERVRERDKEEKEKQQEKAQLKEEKPLYSGLRLQLTSQNVSSRINRPLTMMQQSASQQGDISQVQSSIIHPGNSGLSSPQKNSNQQESGDEKQNLDQVKKKPLRPWALQQINGILQSNQSRVRMQRFQK